MGMCSRMKHYNHSYMSLFPMNIISESNDRRVAGEIIGISK